MRIPLDKQAHVMAGYCISITVALGVIAAMLFFGGVAVTQTATLAGLLVAALTGMLKEVWDVRHPASHTADRWDALSTLFGGALAWGVLTGLIVAHPG